MISDEVCTKGYSGLRYVCPECRQEVRYRNWRNAPPYFAHTRFNPSCSLSVEGDGLFFSGRDRQGNPVDPVDLEKISEGIRIEILIGVAKTLKGSERTRLRAAGISCLIMAEQFGSTYAKGYLERKYGDSYLDFVPMTLEEIRDTAYERGKEVLKRKRVKEAWECIYLSSQLGNIQAEEFLNTSKRLKEYSEERQADMRSESIF